MTRSFNYTRVRELFEAAHEERYGYRDPASPIELVTVRRRYLREGPGFRPAPAPEVALEGPQTIDLGEATIFVPPGWRIDGGADGIYRLIREI